MNATTQAQMYSDVEKLIYHTCHRFAARYGGDIEELIAEANLAFCLAVKRFCKGAGSKFTNWVWLQVWYRLLDMKKKAARAAQRMPTVSLTDAILPNVSTLRTLVSAHTSGIPWGPFGSAFREIKDLLFTKKTPPYFISAKTRGNARVLVSGPYPTEKTAQFEIDDVREFVERRAPWVSFRCYITMDRPADAGEIGFIQRHDLIEGEM